MTNMGKRSAKKNSETGQNTPPFSRAEICEAIIRDLDEPIRVMTNDLKILMANRAAVAASGQPETDLMGLYCDEYLPGHPNRCENCLVKQTFQDHLPHRREISGIDGNGDRWVSEIHTHPILDDEGNIQAVVEIFHDKSHEKSLERQLFQSAKLVSIGELSTGIAHEIRNPLAGIRLGLDALEPSLIQDSSAKEILDGINHDINRLDRVVSELLSFTKTRPSQPEWFHVGPLINQVCRYFRHTAQIQKIKIKIETEPGDLMVWADRNQIQQVLLNLLLNSVQAMLDGGELKISSRYCKTINWSDEQNTMGGYRLVVRDSGTGIPEDDMHRLFDPFFTTKPNGTGLGLTTSLTIIRKHNGELRINSAPGEGTTAQILLPEGPWRC